MGRDHIKKKCYELYHEGCLVQVGNGIELEAVGLHWFPGSIPGRGLRMVGSNGCLKEPSPATDLDGIMAYQGWEL